MTEADQFYKDMDARFARMLELGAELHDPRT